MAWPIKFLRLPIHDRLLLAEALLVVWGVRLGLWLLPFSTLSRLAAKFSSASHNPRGSDEEVVRRVAWAVRRSSKLVPSATCLTQALVGQMLLSRAGRSSRLYIGVAKDEAGGLKAHAWLECEGKIVLGKLRGLSQFTVMTPMEEKTE